MSYRCVQGLYQEFVLVRFDNTVKGNQTIHKCDETLPTRPPSLVRWVALLCTCAERTHDAA